MPGAGEEQDAQPLAGEDPRRRQPDAEQRGRPRDAQREDERDRHDERQPHQSERRRDPVVRHREREHEKARREGEGLGHD